MEYDEMTDEEYENHIVDKAERENERIREDELIAKYEEEERINLDIDLISKPLYDEIIKEFNLIKKGCVDEIKISAVVRGLK